MTGLAAMLRRWFCPHKARHLTRAYADDGVAFYLFRCPDCGTRWIENAAEHDAHVAKNRVMKGARDAEA